MIVATHPASSTSPSIGVERAGLVYELFVATLPSPAFTAKDVLDLYLHRGSFETVLADEDTEQEPDRWCSRTPWGQEFWQILSQWMWNLRLELGQKLSPTAMRTTEFAPAHEAPPVPAPAQKVGCPAPVTYGPPKFARPSFTGGFPGAAFTLQPDGTLCCPAHHPLYPQERRPERDGSYRLLYAARIGDCRACPLRAQCQESLSTAKPRRVSAVFWPIASQQEAPSAPLLPAPSTLPELPDPLPSSPILWTDWERCQIRRRWLKVVRTEMVSVTMGAVPMKEQVEGNGAQVITRAQRAHWCLTWHERYARNARPSTCAPWTLTIHGLPATFATLYGFALLAVA